MNTITSPLPACTPSLAMNPLLVMVCSANNIVQQLLTLKVQIDDLSLFHDHFHEKYNGIWKMMQMWHASTWSNHVAHTQKNT